MKSHQEKAAERAIERARGSFTYYENHADYFNYAKTKRLWKAYKHMRHVAIKLAKKAGGVMKGVAKDLP